MKYSLRKLHKKATKENTKWFNKIITDIITALCKVKFAMVMIRKYCDMSVDFFLKYIVY